MGGNCYKALNFGQLSILSPFGLYMLYIFILYKSWTVHFIHLKVYTFCTFYLSFRADFISYILCNLRLLHFKVCTGIGSKLLQLVAILTEINLGCCGDCGPLRGFCITDMVVVYVLG